MRRKNIGRRILSFTMALMLVAGMMPSGTLLTHAAENEAYAAEASVLEETEMSEEKKQETSQAEETVIEEESVPLSDSAETEEATTKEATTKEATTEEVTTEKVAIEEITTEESETEETETETETEYLLLTVEEKTEKTERNGIIDVWDIGAQQETGALYNNWITQEDWLATGIDLTTAIPSAVTATFGDAQFVLHTGDKICGSVGMDESASKYTKISYPDGYTSTGVWHTNGKGSETRRCVILDHVQAGSRISVYMGSHTIEEDKLYFVYTGSDGSQKDSTDILNRSNAMINDGGVRYDFVAKYNGQYKLYVGSATNLKPVWHRIVRVPAVEVTGTVDVSATTATSYGITFVNNTTEEETVAQVKDNHFSATLTPGYTYTAVLTGVVGVSLTNATKSLTVSDEYVENGMNNVSLKAEAKDVFALQGSVKGFGNEIDMSKVKVILAAPENSQKEDITLHINSDDTYSEYIEPNVEYTVTLENAEEYQVVTKPFSISQDTTLDIEVEKKLVYCVTGKFQGLPQGQEVTSITFIHEEDEYAYTGTVNGEEYTVDLRDGIYSVEAQAGDYTTSTHVIVDGQDVTRDLLFVTTKTESLALVSDIYVGYADKDNNYETVREAIAACKAMNPKSEIDRITVHIAPGVYREQVIIDTPYVSLVNDTPEKEVKLTWYYGVGYKYYSAGNNQYYDEERAFDKYEKNTVTKWGAATYVKSTATGFRAENITFEASFNRYITEEELEDGVEISGESTAFVREAGVDVTTKAATERACALAIEANHAEFYNCNILGSQDTLYTGGEIVCYMKDCTIEGNTDYIFGGGDIVFDACELSFYGYQGTAAGGYITAASEPYRYGYVMNNCTITGNKDLSVGAGYFGRPWRQSASVTFINTKLANAELITATGWTSMSGSTPEKANYMEYNTTLVDGTSVDTSARIEGTVVTENPIPDLQAVFGEWTPYYFNADTDTEESDKKDDLLAFEGAEGGGRYATGGRGGDVYVVTSLEDYGVNETPIEGTLRYGVENASENGRIIVFHVGGTIHLKQTLGFSGKKNITLAGQTAPGDGITLAGYDTNISDSENIIIRFIRFRVGTENLLQGGDSMDALWGRDNDTFMIDHCTFSWNTDETLSTYRGKNGTVQWCIISESLTVSGHSKGRHGYGGIWGGDNTVFQYNLITDHTSRNPRIGGGSMTDPTGIESYATVQISNNILYNWGYFGCYGGGYTWTNYLNNYLKAGKGTRDASKDTVIDFGENGKIGGVYVAGNYLEGNATISADNSKGVTITGSTTTYATTPYEAESFDDITLVSAKDCYPQVLAKAGATYPKRDAIDARVVAQVTTDTGSYINTQDEVGGYCMETVYRESSFDTDGDGIPDAWEKKHGLNPEDASDSAKLAKSGYAYIEEYFNELVEDVVAENYEAKNPTVNINLKDNTLLDEGKSITVTANASANNGGSINKVEFYNGAEKIATVTSAPYKYTISGLKDGTYSISVRAFDNEGNATQSNTAKLHVNATSGSGEWTSKDIGSPAIKGTASLENGVLTVKGAGKLGKSEGCVSGTDLANAKTDDFQFVYQEQEGDVELVTKLESFTAVDNHTFNGVMFRESLAADAAAVGLGLSMVKINETTVWSAYMVNRAKTGANMSEISETIDSAESAEKAGIPIVTDLNFKSGNTFHGVWFKLSREGNDFTGYVSEDGLVWKKVGTLTVSLPDKAYIGFAVDANKVANELENYATAEFSNIKLNNEFVKISYDVTNLETSGADKLATGEDLTVTLTKTTGYLLPETVEVTMGGKAVAYTYNSDTGVIYLPNVTEDVTIKATGVERKIAKVAYEEIDENDFLTVEEVDGKIVLTQTATTGRVAKNVTTPAENESYILFPAVDEYHTLSLKLKVTNLIETNAPKETGIFVGVHDVAGNAYTTLAFRACGTESLCGYWTKSAVKTGNGSPKFEVSIGTVYDITFTTNGKGGYLATFSSDDGTISASQGKREFKANDIYMQTGDMVQYGIGLIGASCEITDMKLVDHENNVIYDQNAEVVEEPDEPETEEPGTEEPGTEEPGTEEPGTEEPSKEEPATGETKGQENTASEGSSGNTNTTITLQDIDVPLAATVSEQTIAGIPYVNILMGAKDTKLRTQLLQKYYGRNLYLMAHLGNGIGFTISSQDAEKQQTDLQLGFDKEQLPDFAEGFYSVRLRPVTEAALSYSVGLHVNVGATYTGKTAYIFEKNLLTGAYERKSTEIVNEIGNVGLFTNQLTDVMILIER